VKVATFSSLTGPGGIEIRETEELSADDGEAVVDIHATSLNRHVLWILEGKSSLVSEDEVPFTSGLDAAGVIHETAEGTDLPTGDRVVGCSIETCGTCRYCREGPENRCESFSVHHGAFAEQASFDAARLIPIPEGLSFRNAAALPTAYLTAWHMLVKADVRAGDLLFVPEATGGVGITVVQLADIMGARTIGTSSSERKLERLDKLGCDHDKNWGP